jgi:hypothetical protein
MRRIILSRLVFLTTLGLGTGIASIATAADKAEKVERIPYQQIVGNAYNGCPNSEFCEVTFPAAPGPLVIHNIACQYTLSSGSVVLDGTLTLGNQLFAPIATTLPVSFVGSLGDNGSPFSAATTLQTLLFVDQGTVPAITYLVQSGKQIQGLACTLSGWQLSSAT